MRAAKIPRYVARELRFELHVQHCGGQRFSRGLTPSRHQTTSKAIEPSLYSCSISRTRFR